MDRLAYLGVVGALVLAISLGCQQSPKTVSNADIPPESVADTDGDDEALATEVPASNEALSPPPVNEVEGTTDNAIANAVAQSCSASAYVADTDPAGLNVRSGPGSNFPAVDTLPTDGPVEVAIVGSANDWFKLTTAWSMQQQELEEDGWVYAPLLGVTTQSSDSTSIPLFDTSDATSAVIAELPPATDVALVNCSDDWLQVQSDNAIGWLAPDNQCGSPAKVCP